MIREIERYHGAVLARLIRGSGSHVTECSLHPRYRSAYVLNHCIAIYVKYSTSRLTPWTFGFKEEHRREITRLSEEFVEVFICLMCGMDGIACLSAQEYVRLEVGGSIRVGRGPRQKYTISSNNQSGVLRIANNGFPAKVHAAIREETDPRARSR